MDFDQGLGKIVPTKDYRLVPARIREAIEGSGFKASGISVTASGTVLHENGNSYLVLDEKERFLLVQNQLLKNSRTGEIRGRFRITDETEKDFKIELVEILHEPKK